MAIVRRRKRRKGGPAWLPCPGNCGEFVCQIHLTHVSGCPCPPIEDWKVDPYSTGGPDGK